MCAEFNLDIARDRIPVRPGAHYMVGGCIVDRQARTTIPHLWAAGEVTSSGLHGANRLASNSLLEGLVFGAYAGEGASAAALEMPDEFRGLPLTNAPQDLPQEPLIVDDILNSLKSLMWRDAGIRRDRAQLTEAASTIDEWCRYVLPRQFQHPQGWQLQNMLTVSRLMVEAALVREESRGVHYRRDFPGTDPQWRCHLNFRRGFEMERETIS